MADDKTLKFYPADPTMEAARMIAFAISMLERRLGLEPERTVPLRQRISDALGAANATRRLTAEEYAGLYEFHEAFTRG